MDEHQEAPRKQVQEKSLILEVLQISPHCRLYRPACAPLYCPAVCRKRRLDGTDF